MVRTHILIFAVGILALGLLGSCASYQRNYAGAVRPLEEVAFFFVDTDDNSLIQGELTWTGPLADSDPPTPPDESDEYSLGIITFSEYGGTLHSIFGKPSCRELLPGSYQVTTRVTKNLDQETQETFGPYDLNLSAQPGRIYCLHAHRKYHKETKPGSLSIKTQPYYEFQIEDVTSDQTYHNRIAQINRKPKPQTQPTTEQEYPERFPVRIGDPDKIKNP